MMQTFEVTRSETDRQSRSSRCWTILLLVGAGFALGFSVAFYLDRSHNNHAANNHDSSSPDDATLLESSSPPVEEEEELSLCDQLYSCQDEHTDRLGHGVPLWAGQAICNDHYRFGVTKGGVLQWHNCETAERLALFDPFVQEQLWDHNASFLFFKMTENGTLQLLIRQDDDINDAEVYWEKVPTLEIAPSRKCLKEPRMDCPYLHLHKSGDVVLNSIDQEGRWSDRKIQKIFDDLYHDPCD